MRKLFTIYVFLLCFILPSVSNIPFSIRNYPTFDSHLADTLVTEEEEEEEVPSLVLGPGEYGCVELCYTEPPLPPGHNRLSIYLREPSLLFICYSDYNCVPERRSNPPGEFIELCMHLEKDGQFYQNVSGAVNNATYELYLPDGFQLPNVIPAGSYELVFYGTDPETGLVEAPPLALRNSVISPADTTHSVTVFIRTIAVPDDMYEPDDFSYVRTRTYTNSQGTSWIDRIKYVDGIGRPQQTVDVGVTPNGENLVAIQDYNMAGKPTLSWLPVIQTGSGCHMKHGVFTDAATLTYGEFPYTKINYDGSPLHRITEEYGPGTAWQSAGKAVRTSYLTNTASYGCTRYEVSSDGLSVRKSGSYGTGSLSVTETVDEDGRTQQVFKNYLDQTVLIRQFCGSQSYDTYYVYDVRGNLCFILPPPTAAGLNATYTWWNIGSNNILRDYAYFYRYDGHDRCVEEKLPGCEPRKMIYDHEGRLVFSQDGCQRMNNEWSVSMYDGYGRLVLVGTVDAESESLLPPVSDIAVKASWNTGGSAVAGYTFNVPLNGLKVLHVWYFDSYESFLGLESITVRAALQKDLTDESGSQVYPSSFSRLTGERIYSATSPSDYMLYAHYYDFKGNILQTLSTNHLGGFDKSFVSYDFTNHPTRRKHIHSATGMSTYTEEYGYTYDHAGRLLSTTHSLNGGTAVTLTENEYDEFCRLTANNRNGNANLRSQYTYNVRSWLTGISNPLFSESLWYNESHEGNTPLWGGNISAQQWQTDGTLRGYNLTYDGLSRLTQAAYRENGSSSSKYTTQYTYDSMGNPLTLKRRGKLDEGSFGLVDNLTYTYDGNRLLTITDANEDEPTYQGAFHFSDGADEDEEYAYDDNGNMTMDLNKGIVSVAYNLLNLPQLITFQDSSKISYLYDADGNKLRVTYTGGALSPVPNSVHTIDYCGNYIYEDGILSRILIDGGYITFENSQPLYHFYIQDHLGNIRVVADQNGVAEQVNHYYPYGGIMADISTNQDIQRHKYNGKEYDRMYGLNLYDYGARHYDPATLAWTTVDPLAEKYYPITPYGYCADNPMNAVDPDGREVHPDELSYQIILNTLSQDEQKYISLNSEGYIDLDRLSQCQSQSNNFLALKDLVNSPFKINVTSVPKTDYYTDGHKYSEYFNPVEIIDDFKDTDFSSCIGNTTGETGNLGVTYMPTSNGSGKAPIDNNSVHININPSLSPLGAAETFSHEGYGHALIYVRTNGNRNMAIHHSLPGFREGNQLLIDYSIKARKETFINMTK